MNQLSMTLFSWIKKHPARGRSLQGLLVIDEARDFIPSGKSVAGKDNIIRLVAQARKYGLGIVFATQAPKSIDHNIIANCSTQFYGRQNSPAAIDTVKEQLQQRGASGSDVAKLPRGVFYAFTEGLSAPLKVSTPLCLSHHPSSPPSEEEVLTRAALSRTLVLG
jgi:DNA helicase HerA-like ATPase